MAKLNKADLKDKNTAQIYENTTQDITGDVLHDLHVDFIDSFASVDNPIFGGTPKLESDLANTATEKELTTAKWVTDKIDEKLGGSSSGLEPVYETTSISNLTLDFSKSVIRITAQATTLNVSGFTNGVTDGDTIRLEVRDNGTRRNITFAGTPFEWAVDVVNQTTSTWLVFELYYNATSGKAVIASAISRQSVGYEVVTNKKTDLTDSANISEDFYANTKGATEYTDGLLNRARNVQTVAAVDPAVTQTITPLVTNDIVSAYEITGDTTIIANVADQTEGKQIDLRLKTALTNGSALTFGDNYVWANPNEAITSLVTGKYHVIPTKYDSTRGKTVLYKPTIQDQDIAAGEIVQTITATGLNPVIDTISKATTIVAVNPLDANLTLSVASGTKSKKLLIHVMGGTDAKTLTLTGFNYVGHKNKIGNSNIFVTVPNKLLIIECSIVIDSNNNESKSVYDWHIEGLDDNPVMNWTNVYYDIVSGYLQSDVVKPELNNEKRPFKDYEEAITALSTLSETNRGKLIMVDNQVHTNKLYTLHPYVDIRAHVRLVESGFICSDNTGSVDIEITGNPRSISPDTEVPMFELSGNCIVRTHTGRVQADRFAFTYNDAKLFVNVHDNMDLRTTGNAYAFSCRDNSWQIYQWNGFGVTTGGYAVSMVGKTTSAGFTGKLHHINFNEMANPVGVSSGLYLVHTLIDNLTTGEVVLQGRKCSYGGNAFAGRKGIITIQNTAATDLTKDNIIVDVDLIDAGNAHAYCLTAGCGAANLLHNGGKIKSNVAPIYSSQTNSGQDLPNNTLRIEGARIYGRASVIGKNRNVILKDTSYENTDAAASSPLLFTFDANSGSNKSTLTIINGIFYTKDGNDSNIAVGATGVEVRLLGSPMGTLKTGLTSTHLIVDKYSQELNITGI